MKALKGAAISKKKGHLRKEIKKLLKLMTLPKLQTQLKELYQKNITLRPPSRICFESYVESEICKIKQQIFLQYVEINLKKYHNLQLVLLTNVYKKRDWGIDLDSCRIDYMPLPGKAL